MSLLFAGSFLQAQTYYVKPAASGSGNGSSWTNAAGATQLAAIISAAASGSQVWVAAGTYYPGATRAAAFVLKSGVALYGGFAGTETTLSQRNWTTNVTTLSGNIGGAGNSYHVVVSNGNTGTTVLDGFTIMSGDANGAGSDTYNGISVAENLGGGVMCYQTTVTISNCTITGNTASSNGGGLYTYGTTVTFTNCAFSNNNSQGEGGGMMINANGGGGYTLTSCTFNNNTATGNGGGLARDNGNVTVAITGCTFTSNQSTSTASQTGGGGVYLANGGLTMTNCSISGNTASGMGGGLLYNQGSNSPITYTTFTNNTATTYGGGMAIVNSSPLVNESNFSKNTGLEGGGIYFTSAGSPSPYLTTDTFSQNKATATGPGGGGAMFANGSNVTLIHSLFLNNVSIGDGAGQYDSTSNVIDSENVYDGNVASGNGGGMVYNGNNPKIYNCVLADNVAAGYGGGMYITNSNGTVMSSTIYNNASTSSTSSTPYGDGVYYLSGNFKFYSNIVWSRSSTTSVGFVASGSSETLDYDDIQNDANLVASYGSYASNHNIGSAPQFGNSGNYAGVDGMWATADDGLHQVSGSPAADVEPTNASGNGDVMAYDITMAARPYSGNTDASMGAYEGPGTFVSLAGTWLGLGVLPEGAGKVMLDWTADGPAAVSDYVVERAVNGGDFQPMGKIVAMAGQQEYQFEDIGAPGGNLSYRIRQDEGGGGLLYSNIVSLTTLPAGYSASLRPSVLTQGATNIFIAVPHAMMIDLVIADGSGAILMHTVTGVSAGGQNIALGGLHFPAGVYYLRLRGDDGFATTIPLVKL